MARIFSGSTIPEQVLAAVLGAVATAIGGYLLSLLTGGWLIHLFGGATPTDVEQIIQNHPGITLAAVSNEITKRLESAATAPLPKDIVIASTVQCTELGNGWESFREAKGRFIIGAGEAAHRAYNMWDRQRPDGGVDPTPLATYMVLAKGGEEKHILSLREMPRHRHDFSGKSIALGGYNAPAQNLVGVGSPPAGSWGTTTPIGEVAPAGEEQPHNIMPPYIALYFCRSR